jgi:pimeloyl-ACP methyl ester carboxylesterase
MPIAALDRLRLNYQRSGAGRALVLVHGFAAGWGVWEPQIAHFASHVQVVTLPPSRFLAATLPLATLVVIPGAAHLTKLEQPAAFNAAVARFVSDIWMTGDRAIRGQPR